MLAVNVMNLLLIITNGMFVVSGSLSLDSAEMRVLDSTFGNCEVKILPTKPKSIDLDVHAFSDAKDVLLQFGAFSFIDGKYNEVIETEKVSICDLPKSDNPLVQFMYKEMKKVGNLTTACPVLKGHYYVHGLTVYESDVPMPLPSGKFKLEVNGTAIKDDNNAVPLFELDIFFTESV
ncbi:unnamed protein product [Chironomus riparius]|uniref:MD-2-related lipid-recognition domain-containing protein n=1 Tax=Chironomus riparius TaxID=315576 RepID=A0A9N9S7V7_9DIPT|nr:unnamed protein product [Chironomus riparius]